MLLDDFERPVLAWSDRPAVTFSKLNLLIGYAVLLVMTRGLDLFDEHVVGRLSKGR